MAGQEMASARARTIREAIRNRANRGRKEQQVTLLERLSSNQLVNVLIGFVLTGIVGLGLTNHYADKQRVLDQRRLDDRIHADRIYQEGQKKMDVEREIREKARARLEDQEQRKEDALRSRVQREWELRRAYVDELNKTRVLKIAEVWEKVFLYDAAISKATSEQAIQTQAVALQKIGQLLVDYPQIMNEEQAKNDPVLGPQIRRILEPYTAAEDSANQVAEIADRYRFWLGDKRYSQISQYLSMSRGLAGAIHGPKSALYAVSPDIEAIRRRRDSLRQQFASLRDEIWKE